MHGVDDDSHHAEMLKSLSDRTCHRSTAQRAIADYLDRETARIDALIAAKQRTVKLLDERWQVVMHDAAAGRLDRDVSPKRATSIPWLSEVPAHWREGHLKLVAKLGTGHTPSRAHPEWWLDLTIPWITTGEVAQMRSDRIEYITETREHISEVGMANSSATLHPADTVVLCRTASAGYSAIMGRAWRQARTSQRGRADLCCARASCFCAYERCDRTCLEGWPWDQRTRRSTCPTSNQSRFPFRR